MIDSVPTIDASTIGIDFRANTLTVLADLRGDGASGVHHLAGERLGATIDIGTQGRLLGLELEDGTGAPVLAVAIADATPGDLAVMRSARVEALVERRGASAATGETLAIVFSRHGASYDISWPSGNQCWQRSAIGPDGRPTVTCAVVTSS
ncbi:MAG: hypothetical protein WBA46_02920 [Thermomicrobiales bacterium]